MAQLVAVIDFEATALSKAADVIEAGLAIYDRDVTIQVWSSLVRPSPNCLWDEKAAQVHNISRAELVSALEPLWVASELNRLMATVRISTVHCDGYQYDSVWMRTLFEVAGIGPGFTIEPLDEMPRMHLRVVKLHINSYLQRTMVPHRAGEDAVRLLQAYAYALGKNRP